MPTVLDVAAYILEKEGPITAWKLQKLVYYSQAWSLVWDEQPLFPEEIQAWLNGPVCPDLYEKHKGKFKIDTVQPSNPQNLSQDQKETVDAVLGFYGPHLPHRLTNLTYTEKPWIEARKGLSTRERGKSVITLDSMVDYYGSIYESETLPEDACT